MDPLRTRAASRTWARSAGTPDSDHRDSAIVRGALHHKSYWHQGGRSESLLHGVDSLGNNASQNPNFIKIESEPNLGTMT